MARICSIWVSTSPWESTVAGQLLRRLREAWLCQNNYQMKRFWRRTPFLSVSWGVEEALLQLCGPSGEDQPQTLTDRLDLFSSVCFAATDDSLTPCLRLYHSLTYSSLQLVSICPPPHCCLFFLLHPQLFFLLLSLVFPSSTHNPTPVCAIFSPLVTSSPAVSSHTLPTFSQACDLVCISCVCAWH